MTTAYESALSDVTDKGTSWILDAVQRPEVRRCRGCDRPLPVEREGLSWCSEWCRRAEDGMPTERTED